MAAVLALVTALGLTLPATASPPRATLAGETAARAWLVANRDTHGLSAAQIAAMTVVRDYHTPALGLETLWLQQTAGGVPVNGAEARFGINAAGVVVWSHLGGLRPALGVDAASVGGPTVAVHTALASAAQAAGIDLGATSDPVCAQAHGEVVLSASGLMAAASVAPRVLPSGERAWLVQLEGPAPHGAWTVLVDASNGSVVRAEQRVFHVQDGLVFAGQYPDTRPGGVPQSLRSFGITPQSPAGWLFAPPDPRASESQGNNCDVKEDWPSDNESTPGGHANGGASQQFRFSLLNSWETAGDFASDRDVALTNVFFWTNRWHDLMYGLGFDEVAGNCQESNFARGGLEGDAIHVDVQNGAQATPPVYNTLSSVSVPVDGGRPRMALYLWDGGLGARSDAAFDADVILHELTHVMVARLVGGPATSCVTGVEPAAVVEGIADFIAADELDSPVIGEYVSGNLTRGVRDSSLDGNSRDYCDFSPALDVYQRGGILASTLWELRQVTTGPVLRQLVVDALKLLPCNPDFLNVRDALVAADLLRFSGANRCAIWDAFLNRGMGFVATAGGGTTGCDLIFNLPACSNEAFLKSAGVVVNESVGNLDGLISLGETVDLTLTLTNIDGAATAGVVSATLTPLTPGITMLVGTVGWADIAAGASGQNPTPFRFSVGPGYVCGVPIVFDLSYQWIAPARQRRETLTLVGTSIGGVGFLVDDAESAGSGWTLTAPATLSTLENHTPAGASSYYLSGACWLGNEPSCPATRGPCDNTCATIQSPEIWLPAEEAVALSFWARYNLQTGTDAVLVEVSDDGGLSFSPAVISGAVAVAGSGVGCGIPAGTTGLSGPAGNAGLGPWSQHRAELAAWAGRKVIIRIVQHLSACIYFEGAFIDDIELLPALCQVAPFAKLHALSRDLDDTLGGCSDRDGLPDPAETIAASVTVVNLGSARATAASATLQTGNANVTGLPDVVALGDLAPGATAPASFLFAVAPQPSAGCNDDAGLQLRYDSSLPSVNVEPWPARVRTNPASVWRDDFEGTRPAWVATLGPVGSAQDWAVREMDCLTTGGNRYFWATQQNLVASVCSTGEPDYRNDSDSVLTSPDIDLGTPGATLVELSWSSFGIANTISNGPAQVLIDHDNDGLFTSIATIDKGFGAASAADGRHRIDLTNPPDGFPLPAASTTQNVKVRFHFRALSSDPGNVATANGWLVDAVELRYLDCQTLDCSACDPPPVFAGITAAVDLDPCAATGVELGWTPAPFGPAGGSYTVLRDGVVIASGLTAPPWLDVPGDVSSHDYEVRAVTAVCRAEVGGGLTLAARDGDSGTPPPALGNVLLAVKSASAATLTWSDPPGIVLYDVAYSDSRDFGLPITSFASPTSGSPGASDPGVIGTPGIRSYRVATVACGLTSSY